MNTREQVEETTIEPPHGWGFPDMRELWAHRDLVYFLARRDVVARYRQAVVGTFWAILQPILLAAAFSVFLGLLANVKGPPGISYPVFAVVGMVIWIPFTNAVALGSTSAVTSQTLISKIYLPRVTIPVAAVIPPTIDFALGLLVAIAISIGYGFPLTFKVILAPAAWGLAAMTALGFVLWFSALNVKYRDIGQLVPFVILIGLFVTPIIYPFSQVPANLQAIYSLNPMVGVLELFRWTILPTDFPGALLLIPVVVSTVLVLTGAVYFQRAQRSFADVI